ncbi:MAG: hypothetical protein IJV45_10200 [Prevotella sp.]|nr:hypothetical protein [Prevotella sp.]
MNRKAILTLILTGMAETAAWSQQSAADSVMQHDRGNRLSIGGYGEVAMTRNFYSDNTYRYSRAAQYKDDPSHGRFDIPHAVIYMGYNFGKGWTLGTEIEFEHTGTGSSAEHEFEEAAEWEREQEKGGEVELEQFWIQKRFSRALNLKIGHIIVPVGLNNAHHEPLNFFTVYRPEGEDKILPSTWHDTGLSLWGRVGKFRYEATLTAGLDAFLFNRDGWIHKGAGSPLEYKVANKYGLSARIDNYSIPGLRMAVSGFVGNTLHNSDPHDMENEGNRNKDAKGTVIIGSFDFTYNAHNWIVRGQADYGHLSDVTAVYAAKATRARQSNSPYSSDNVGEKAVAIGIEAGYDVFSQFERLRASDQQMYVFGRFEHYNPYIPAKGQMEYQFTEKNRMAVGINYFPVPQIAVKAEFSKRFLKQQYNDEPSISVGVAYEGFFL